MTILPRDLWGLALVMLYGAGVSALVLLVSNWAVQLRDAARTADAENQLFWTYMGGNRTHFVSSYNDAALSLTLTSILLVLGVLLVLLLVAGAWGAGRLRVRSPIIAVAYFLSVPQVFLLHLGQVAPQFGLADPVSLAVADPGGLVSPFNAQGWISQALLVGVCLCGGAALYALRRRGQTL